MGMIWLNTSRFGLKLPDKLVYVDYHHLGISTDKAWIFLQRCGLRTRIFFKLTCLGDTVLDHPNTQSDVKRSVHDQNEDGKEEQVTTGLKG